MKEYIDTYYKFKDKVDGFIEDSLNNFGNLSRLEESNFKDIFAIFRTLELMYVIDAQTSMQTSPNIYAGRLDEEAKDHSRAYLIDRLEIKENGFAFTAPYKSAATQNLCITVTKKEDNKIIF